MPNNDLIFDPLGPQDDESLEIAEDIYSAAHLLPIGKNKDKENKNGNNGNNGKSAPNASATESIAQVMNSNSKSSICPCCNQADCDTSLTQNQIFVETRADSDPLFLDKDDIMGTEEEDSEAEGEAPKEFSKEEISNEIMSVVFQEKYDPSNFEE